MSKAFTTETDVPDAPLLPIPQGRRPITARGMAALQATLRQLVETDRPAVVLSAQSDESLRPQLRALDHRIQSTATLVSLCDVVAPISAHPQRVAIGTRVRLRDEAGNVAHYGLVGPDETDVAQGAVSCLSPLGQALLGLAVGAWAEVQRPKGLWELEVLSIEPLES